MKSLPPCFMNYFLTMWWQKNNLTTSPFSVFFSLLLFLHWLHFLPHGIYQHCLQNLIHSSKMNSAPKLSCCNKFDSREIQQAHRNDAIFETLLMWSQSKKTQRGKTLDCVTSEKTRQRTLNVHFNNQIVICNSSVILITFEMKDLYYTWIILQGGTKYWWQFISFFCNVFEQLLILVLYSVR